MIDDFLDFIRMVALPILLLAAILAPMPLGFAYMDCKNKAEILQVERDWRVFGGCFIKYNDRWMHYNEYLNRQIARELKDD